MAAVVEGGGRKAAEQSDRLPLTSSFGSSLESRAEEVFTSNSAPHPERRTLSAYYCIRSPLEGHVWDGESEPGGQRSCPLGHRQPAPSPRAAL